MVLNIKSNDDIPYGVLTLQKNEIIIEGKKWKTPCHFILSHMFPEGMIRESVRQALVPDLYRVYKNACDKIILQTVGFAIHEYLKVKSSQSKFINDLLQTGDRKLYSDIFPKNVYGKYLEQLRFQHQVKNDVDPLVGDRSNDPVFYMYLAERALKELLLENNLQEFVDQKFMRMSDLLRYLEKKYGKERIFRKAPDRSTILQIHKQRNVDFTTNPTTLIKLVRRQNIRKCYDINLSKIKYIIFECFINSVKHLHPAKSFERDECIQREKETLPTEKVRIFIQRTWLLYNDNAFSESLMNTIRRKISNVYIPSEEEIHAYETDVFPLYPGHEREELKLQNHEDVKSEIFNIPKSSLLSPYAVDYCMIQHFNFPTLIHYVTFKCIMSEKPDLEAQVVFKKLSLVKTEELLSILDDWVKRNRNEKLTSIVRKTLIHFLKDDEIQYILLSTGNDKILINNDWFPNLGEEIVKLRKHIQPKIYKITSLDHIKRLQIVKQWTFEQNSYIIYLKKVFDAWLLKKNCASEIHVRDVIRYFFFYSSSKIFHSFNEYVDFMVGNFKKFKTDLQIYDYILKMQYIFSHKWVKRNTHHKLVDNETYDMILHALCKILIIFDRLTDKKVLIEEHDVDYAKAILFDDNAVEEQSLINENQEESEEEKDDESENDEIDYNEQDFEEEFEGNDNIYRFLSDKCHNNLSDYIENYLFDVVKKIDSVSPRLRSRINFFSGSFV